MKSSKQQSELQRLLSLVDNMSQVASSSSKDSTQNLLHYYLENVQGLQIDLKGESDNLNGKAATAFQDLFSKLQLLQKEYAKLEKTKQAGMPSPPSEIPQSIRKMMKISAAVVTLQAWWRKILTLRRLEKDAKLAKASLNARKSNQSPEELAMKEFASQLKTKKLTPESFFRICDTDYKQTVTVSNFKEMLSSLNIQLTRAQMSRLIMILDEDIEGNITIEEYHNALEAYGVSGEKHKPMDGSALYHPFEHRCLFKLITHLNKKGISFIEMFNACDINDDSRVNINEMRNFVEGLTPDFKQKEIHALMTYIDLDKNGLIDKDEFLRQLTKGEQTMRQTQVLNKQIAEKRVISRAANNNFMRSREEYDDFMRFEEEDVGPGTQSFNPGVSAQGRPSIAKPSTSNATQQTGSLNSDQIRRKQIIERMEKEGVGFQSFLDSLKKSAANGVVPLGTVLKTIEQSYPTISSLDRNFLVKECIKDRTKIDFVIFEELFARYAKNLLSSSTQTFQAIATNISIKMGASPQESLKQFFRAQGLSENDVLSDLEFSQIFSRAVSGLSDQALSSAFSSLNIDSDGFISVRDIMEVLQSYMINNRSVPALGSSELKRLIPNYETMSPRTRTESVIKVIMKELVSKSLKALSVFKMADANNIGEASALALEAAFKKMLPNLKPEVIKEAMKAFKAPNPHAMIPRNDFEIVFAEDHSLAKPTSSKQAQQPAQAPPKKFQEEDEGIMWIKKLDNAFLMEGVSPSIAFKAADSNHNGVITVDELRESIKRLIPDETLPLIELKKVMMAFDKNRNGTIEEKEFIDEIQKARNSSITVVDSPAKPSRILNENLTEDRRNKLPLKEQVGDRTKTTTGTGGEVPIALTVSNVDDKVNLKKIFSDIVINEHGQVTVNFISRRLKQATGPNGATLSPSEYMPIIKALDPKASSIVSAKDVIQFLEKYCKSNSTDNTFDLKYIANFIEFQVKNRNTKQFLISNSSLKSGQRLLEVEVMTELNKAFGISMKVGNSIYKSLVASKGNSNIAIEDLCTLIDSHRVIPVADVFNPTEAQKLEPEQVLKKAITNFKSFPAALKKEISVILQQVDKIEKQIPYSNFQTELAENNQIITIAESKALYLYLKAVHKNLTYQVLQTVGLMPPNEQPKAVPSQQQPIQPAKKDPAVDMKLLVKTIEDALGTTIESQLESIFEDEEIASISLKNKITSGSPKVDQKQVLMLIQAMNSTGKGTTSVKDIIAFLSKIAGKYDQEKALSELMKNIEQPFEDTLASIGIQEDQPCSKNDYILITQYCPGLTKFTALALFYDLSGNEDEMFGGVLLEKLRDLPAILPLKNPNLIAQSQSDPHVLKALMSEFVTKFDSISTDAIIQSALGKFLDVIKKSKDPLKAIDPSGKGLLYADQYKAVLDGFIPTATADEKLVLTFIPIEAAKGSNLEVNLTRHLSTITMIKTVSPAVINGFKRSLAATQQALKALVPDQSSQITEEAKSPSRPLTKSPSLRRQGTSLQKRIKDVEPFVNLLNKHLADPAKRDQLRNEFLSHPNNEMQFFDLTYFIETNWKESLSDSLTEAYLDELDNDGDENVTFNEFVAFCQGFGVKVDFQPVESSPQSRKAGETGRMMKCGSLTFELIESKHYYKGVKTILTSEEAALVVAEELYNSITDDDFFDKDFGPKSAGDEEGSANSLYFDGVPPPGYTDPSEIEWRKPEEFCDDPDSVKFIDGGASANDVRQGKIGNCWLISALSVLATRDELLKGGISDSDINISNDMKVSSELALKFSKGVYPPIFHSYRKKGLYVFKFFKNLKWVYVIVDDRIPCYSEGLPVFCTCVNINEMWVPLIEKAYAKLHGCYQALISGFVDDGLSDLTGFVAEKLILHGKDTGAFPHESVKDADYLWSYLQDRKKEKSLMGCSRSGGNIESQVIIDGNKTGILAGHAYGLMDVIEIDNPERPQGRKTHRLLRVRNPWGNTEYALEWSDSSPELEEHREQIQAYIDSIEDKDEKFEIGAEDGTFLINYKNFRNIYNNLFVCVDFPTDWSGVRFNAAWDAENSFGLPAPFNDPQQRSQYAKNPQFLVDNTRRKFTDLELFVSLAQPDGRGLRDDNGIPSKFPYKEVINPVIICIFKIPDTQDRLTKYDTSCQIWKSVLKEHREVSVRAKLGPGKYIIVPSTAKAGETGEFFLSIYFNKSVKDIRVQRLDRKQNFNAIMEESENTNNVPEWKIELCQQRLKTMISGDEDDTSFSPLQNKETVKLSYTAMMNKSFKKSTHSAKK